MTRLVPLLLLFCSLALAQEAARVFTPQHRLASELLPTVQSLASPGGSVSVFDNKLVVRASAAQMAEIEQVLASLDKPARQFLITLRQDQESSLDRRAVDVGGVYKDGDTRIIIPRSNGGLRSRAEVELEQQTINRRSGGTQQIRAEEGREAQVFLGQSLPYRSRYSGVEGGTVERTEYIDAGSGFTVLPRLQGNRVQLEIALRQQLPGPGGTFNVQSSSSTVSGPLGEWFDIGGAVMALSSRSNALLSGERESGAENRKIMVKVEEVQ